MLPLCKSKLFARRVHSLIYYFLAACSLGWPAGVRLVRYVYSKCATWSEVNQRDDGKQREHKHTVHDADDALLVMSTRSGLLLLLLLLLVPRNTQTRTRTHTWGTDTVKSSLTGAPQSAWKRGNGKEVVVRVTRMTAPNQGQFRNWKKIRCGRRR